MSQNSSNQFNTYLSTTCSNTFEIGFVVFETEATDYLNQTIHPHTPCLYHRHVLDDTQTDSELIQSIINSNGESVITPVAKLNTFPETKLLDTTDSSKCEICTYNSNTVHYYREMDYSTIPTYSLTRIKFSDRELTTSIICEPCLREITLLWASLYRNHHQDLTANLL